MAWFCPPDEQLLCYDYLYYLCANEVTDLFVTTLDDGFTLADIVQPFDFEKDYNPSWRFVAKHFRWKKPIEALAERYLRHTLGISDRADIPPVCELRPPQ